MEILILGLILVALMVYLSTRIKRAAALAYEREAIETEEFSIVKPEGFLVPIKEATEFKFEAYSKECGHEEAGNIRQAAAKVTVLEGVGFDEACEQIRASAGQIVAESTPMIGGRHVLLLDAEKETGGVTQEIFHKLVSKTGTVYDLEITVLQEHKDAHLRNIDDLRTSFTLK